MQPNNNSNKSDSNRNNNRFNSVDGIVNRRDYNPMNNKKNISDIVAPSIDQPAVTKLPSNLYPETTPQINSQQVLHNQPNSHNLSELPNIQQGMEQASFPTQPQAAHADAFNHHPIDFRNNKTRPVKNRFSFKKKRFNRVIKYALLGIVALICLSAVIILFVWQSRVNSPQNVFTDAINSNLKLGAVNTTVMTDNGVSNNKYDFNDNKNPIVVSKQLLTKDGLSYGTESYSNSKQTYFKYSNLPQKVDQNLKKSLEGTFVKIRDNNVADSNIPEYLMSSSDPRYKLVGPVLLGNFDEKNYEIYVKNITTNNVYSYNTKNVATEKIDKEKVYVYDVKIKKDFIKSLNQSAAYLRGYSVQEMQGPLSRIDYDKNTSFRFYISKSKHKLMKISTKSSRGTSTITYNSYDKNQTPVEPASKIVWQYYASNHIQMQAQAYASLKPEKIDNVRKQKLFVIQDYIKKYYDQSGTYPAFDQLNNTTWNRDNLYGFDADLLRDPVSSSMMLSTSPKQSSVSYSVFSGVPNSICDGTPAKSCMHYRLVTTFSNGQQFTLSDT